MGRSTYESGMYTPCRISILLVTSFAHVVPNPAHHHLVLIDLYDVDQLRSSDENTLFLCGVIDVWWW